MTELVKASASSVSRTNKLMKQISMIGSHCTCHNFGLNYRKDMRDLLSSQGYFLSREAKVQRNSSPVLEQDNSLVHCIPAHG